MLSYQIDEKLSFQLRDLSNKIAVSSALLSGLPDAEREAIHHFARVSQVGASTRIENAVLTDSEVNWIDTLLSKDAHVTAFQDKRRMIIDKLSKDRERSIEEVVGCRDMLLLIYEQGRDFFPLTETIIRALHQQLLKFHPPAHHYLGKYKTATNSVVERNVKTGTQRTVFQTADPGPMTDTAMRKLIDWYNGALSKYPWTLAVACEFVFRFLAIHPFQDGNGRLGRGLFLLSLLHSSDEPLANSARYIAIDRQIERHRPEYYFVLQQCSGGKFNQDSREYHVEHFLKYMLKIMNLALNDIEVYRKRYEVIAKLPDSALQVLECLKEYPERRLQTKDMSKSTGRPHRTLNHAIRSLLKNSLIQKRGQGSATRYQIVF